MHDNRAHPLLEQVPLAVSPFVNLPRATTLPYRYKAMPSALPPSVIEGPAQGPGASSSGKPAYVVAPDASLAAHPDDIAASCRALREHLAKLQASASADLREIQAFMQARDLAEKRRVAPGWLDSDERLLVPERQATPGSAGNGGGGGNSAGTYAADGSAAQPSEMAAPVPDAAGAQAGADAAGSGGLTAEALDQAFGGIRL